MYRLRYISLLVLALLAQAYTGCQSQASNPDIRATVNAGVQATVAGLRTPTPALPPQPTPYDVLKVSGGHCPSNQSGCPGRVAIRFQATTNLGTLNIPQDVLNKYDKPGYRWIAVNMEVILGKLEMQGLWANSRVETSDGFYSLSSASGEITHGVQPSGQVLASSSIIALYQIPSGVSYSWNLDKLDQEVWIVR